MNFLYYNQPQVSVLQSIEWNNTFFIVKRHQLGKLVILSMFVFLNIGRYLNDNKLEGFIPSSLGQLKSLNNLYV